MELTTAILTPNSKRLPEDLSATFTYWQEKRGDRLAPAWGKFRLDELKPSVLTLANVVDVIGDPPDFIFRFFGTTRVRLQGRDFTGCSVRQFEPSDIGEKIHGELVRVVESREAIHAITEGTTSYGEHLQYDFLRLPLSSDNRTVDKIFSVGLDDRSLRMLQRERGTELSSYPGTS